jgi:hypothetical protein
MTGDSNMKIEKLVKKLNQAEFEHRINRAKELWVKILKKSLKHKHTEQVQ